ncbi:putative pentatricopeptide repeat-containing protein [Platanthera guangdongensis]|uniref:Pentatricopeptide repeat-containing protein n=1 Tax=Platanthera guangdongensis TaxID=2320717 RepID=A0ABR2MPJ3_9ASPA
MLLRSVQPNQFTFPSLLKSLSAAGDARSLIDGRQVHAHVFKLGFHPNSFSQNNLIAFYFTCALHADSRRVLDKMLPHDVLSWTTMLGDLCHFGLVDEARNLFDIMPERKSVSWNAMISGYVKNESFAEAFELFPQMLNNGIWPDKFAAATMLGACTGLMALSQGEWIHAQIKKSEIDLDLKLVSTIIDMYCKCGRLEKAYEVFNGLPTKWLSSWNCMIGGLAIHGHGEAAIKLFKEM